jgi:hypothetical protein
MKYLVIIFLGFSSFIAKAQSYDAQVLLLNFAKYESMRQTVVEVKDTYEILSEWYGKIQDVADGDLKLHTVFLDELKAISPAVTNYYKIAEIIKKQKMIVNQYDTFFGFVRQTENFNEKEIKYLENIFSNLLLESGDYLEQLFMVITASEMNMSDDERIKLIDTLSDNVDGQLSFLSELNEKIHVLSAYKDKEKKEIKEYEQYTTNKN